MPAPLLLPSDLVLPSDAIPRAWQPELGCPTLRIIALAVRSTHLNRVAASTGRQRCDPALNRLKQRRLRLDRGTARPADLFRCD
jgi:hypothetical protein